MEISLLLFLFNEMSFAIVRSYHSLGTRNKFSSYLYSFLIHIKFHVIINNINPSKSVLRLIKRLMNSMKRRSCHLQEVQLDKLGLDGIVIILLFMYESSFNICLFCNVCIYLNVHTSHPNSTIVNFTTDCRLCR